jgi:hypothetical protein
MISRDGGSVQLWYGGGEDSSHSRPCEASQTWLVLGEPLLTHFQMMYGSSSCEAETERADRRDHVPVGELHRVIGIRRGSQEAVLRETARHKKMADKVPVASCVVHLAAPLGSQ